MRRRHKVALVAAAAVVAGVATVSGTHHTPRPASTGACGIERWDVKTGQDPAARQVNLTAQATTVAALAALPAPPGPTGRIGQEYQTYTVHGTLIAYKTETDSDYHLVFADAQARTVIAEIPAPACVGSSPFAAAITAARAALDAHLKPGGSYQTAAVPVTVTGVAFFDRVHGQRGVAGNGIELHPVLRIAF
ncbi:MAG: hypothetical protein M3N21_08585 [Actinomycetota bacterium]|nr:hypothetical protein [Actinomycetota bacterium]